MYTKHEMIVELKYSNTNTYLIRGSAGCILFDTGWAGTFPLFCKAIKEAGITIPEIRYILISHFHPDHMGIAEEIAECGPKIVVFDVQKSFIHAADSVFEKENNRYFKPIREENVMTVSMNDSRRLIKEIGLNGEVLATPGHSDDSISLYLDEGFLFVGDLNPLYELELHKGTEIEKSWNMLLKHDPHTIYYGHAKTGIMHQNPDQNSDQNADTKNRDLYELVQRIMHYIDKGYSIEKIKKKTSADACFIEDVNRMYLTHRNVGVQGILDRIEIKGR